ncbi:hypothetical protein J4N45_22065 [Vibrio sp. SCSIO 43140]|uniref:DUF6279 family lipoprotein n=1 Tax=Vibrio sp. SCSIO 43140 TaxID=2819100 RepID=UPI002074FA5F|nr:DUF6279 family lipoprotein [Vibrio sp. SCSIO 43140]USD63659.1 hypothetical protein J4N45_22065 [Vibrio sp. SCSIO 43140]
MFKKSRLWAVGLLFVITGCTTKFLYSNLDWLLVEYIDDYVTLNDGQEDILSERILVLGQWHKENELPQYVKQLDAISNKDPKQVDSDYVLAQMDEVKTHTKRLVEQITPDLYALTQQMSDEQVKELIENFEEKNRDFVKKYEGMNDDEVREIYHERIEENFERWFGSVNDTQKLLAKEWASSMKVTVFDWQEHRKQMNYYMRQLLNRRGDLAYYQPEFQRFLNDSESYYTPELAAKIAHNRALAAKYIALAVNSINTKQQSHLASEIDEWKTIAEDLMTSMSLDHSPREFLVFTSYTEQVLI